MTISTKSRYALRMMIDIAQNSQGKWVAMKEIAKRQQVSIKYLEQIVTYLTKSKLLRSGRGPQGGYMLTKDPSDYTVGEILRAIEGNLAPVSCLVETNAPCDRKQSCPTIAFWKGLHMHILQYVDRATLQDLIEGQVPNI